jgi:hypothetical protein
VKRRNTIMSRSGDMVISRIEIELAAHGGNDNGRLPVTIEDFVRYVEAEYSALETRRQALWQEISNSLHDGAPSIGDIEWPKPAEGDDDADPLFDSKRGYVEQMDRYKRHQGKATTRKGRAA